MTSLSTPNNLAPACGCLPSCVDVASGILVQRHGLTAAEARGSVTRSAERQNAPVHVISQEIIDSVTSGRPWIWRWSAD